MWFFAGKNPRCGNRQAVGPVYPASRLLVLPCPLCSHVLQAVPGAGVSRAEQHRSWGAWPSMGEQAGLSLSSREREQSSREQPVRPLLQLPSPHLLEGVGTSWVRWQRWPWVRPVHGPFPQGWSLGPLSTKQVPGSKPSALRAECPAVLG